MVKKNIIAFQGVAGANSDLACRNAYPYMETCAYSTFDQAVHAVEEGHAELCMLPIENSRAGRVAEIHNILPNTNLYIVGEYFQRIEFYLMAPKGASLESIEQIYSHPQALMQCKEHLNEIVKLRQNPKEFSRLEYSNTAFAAKSVASWGDITKAAIAPKLAAELYQLDILKSNIEDDKNNTTIFFAMGREPVFPSKDSNKVITSLFFRLRNIPAALYKAIGGFATNNVNLLKIESYIPGGHSDTAQFFVSFEGHPEDNNVRLAIEELGFFCNKVKMLGVYLAAESRIIK